MLRYAGLRAAALVSIIMLLSAGCGGGQSTIAVPEQQAALLPAASGWPAGLPVDGVQPWESVDADGYVIPAGRDASIYNGDSEFCRGAEYAHSSVVGLSDHGDAVLFCSGAHLSGEYTWAYWRLTMGGDQPGAVGADVNVLPMSNGELSEYWLGLSDYGSGRWQWHGPFSESHLRLSTAEYIAAGSDYLSEYGNLFICVVAEGGASFDVVGVAANAIDDTDTEAPPAPTGLTATPIAGGLELGWQPVIADDLAGYRVYWRDDWFYDQHATGLKSVGWLEGHTRHMLPVSTDAPAHLRISAIDISGNESGLSELVVASPLTGDPPPLQLTASAPSGMLNDAITLTASGADSYDWDLDGDGTYEVTEDTVGTQAADTSATGLIRPAVRGSLGDEGCVACGSVSLLIAGNSRPVATAWANPASGQAPLSVTFTGGGDDPDGEIENYAWDFDGDGTYDYNSDTQPNPPVQVYSNAGLYNAKLRVTDDQDAWDVDTVSVQVLPAPDPNNQPPVADLTATPDSGDVPLQVHYDAGASTDPDGTIMWYAWDFTGDGIYTGLTDMATHTYEYTEPGLYVCKVRVVDDDGACSTDTFEVTVNSVGNELPVAGLTAAPLSGDAPLTVSFGEDASDPDGSIVRYDWDFDGDGLYEIYDGGDEIDYTYTQPGIYSAGIRVTDDDGAQDTDTAEITVNVPGNASPAADVTATPASGDAPLEVDFDASGSSDTDGSIVRYDWDLDGDDNYELYDGDDSPDWVYATPGIRSAQVRVTDDDGAQSVDSVDITVNVPGNDSPEAVISANPDMGAAPLDVDFDAGDSTDSDGTIVNHEWDFNGDGVYDSYGSSSTASHTYSFTGTYAAKVRVTDNDGAQDAATVSILVITGTWDIQAVDTAGNVGEYTSLAVVDGNPAISYHDGTNGNLKYVRATDASGSVWGTPLAVDTADNVGKYTSLAVVNGNPAISYHDATSGNLKYVRATDASGSAWGTPLHVDTATAVGSYTSLAVVNGNPAISYFDASNGNLKYVRATDASGSAWGTPLHVDEPGSVGYCTSLVVVNGNPAISYHDLTNNDLKYARLY